MRVSVPRRRKDTGNERGDGAKVGRRLGRGPGRPPFKLPKIPSTTPPTHPPMLKTDAADLDTKLSGGLFWKKNYRWLPRRKKSWSRGCAASPASGRRRAAPDVLEPLNESD